MPQISNLTVKNKCCSKPRGKTLSLIFAISQITLRDKKEKKIKIPDKYVSVLRKTNLTQAEEILIHFQ